MFLLFLLVTEIGAAFDYNLIKVVSPDHWPRGRVPYEIVPELSEFSLEVIDGTKKAIQENTCVKLVPKNASDEIFISFGVRNKKGIMTVGYTDAPLDKFVNMENFGKELPIGQMIHELLHFLGLADENNRPDRDEYVEVIWKYIPEKDHRYFKPVRDAVTFNLPYDYHSIMHQEDVFVTVPSFGGYYPSLKPKHEAEANRDGIKIGQRFGMTCNDIMKINFLYNCTKQLKTELKSKYLLKGSCPPIVLQSFPQAGDESEGYMLYAEDKRIYKMSLSNYADRKFVVRTETEDLFMDVDCKNGRVFWYDKSVNTIYIAELLQNKVVRPSGPTRKLPIKGVGGIAFYLRNNHLYLTYPEEKMIFYMEVNFNFGNDFFPIKGRITTEGTPKGIALAHIAKFLFWYECLSTCSIKRANIKRKNPKPHNVTTVFQGHRALFFADTNVLHVSRGKIYGICLAQVFSCDFDGKNFLIYEGISGFVQHIASSKDWIYFSGTGHYPYSAFRTYRAKKDQNDSITWIAEQLLQTGVRTRKHSGIHVCPRVG